MYTVELNAYHRENTMPCVDVKELRESYAIFWKVGDTHLSRVISVLIWGINHV